MILIGQTGYGKANLLKALSKDLIIKESIYQKLEGLK